MYYPSQSPGIGHKMQNHHEQAAWPRTHYPPPGAQTNVGPPTSPGFALYNPAVGHMQHHPGPHPHALASHPPMHHHHHQNSLTHYSSPQNGHALPAHLAQASPGVSSAEISTPHWQNQLMKCEMVRASRSPHHRARASALASRTVVKSAIPITNPNAIPVKAPPDTNGNGKEIDSPAAGTASAVASPSTPAATQANHPSSTVAPVAEVPHIAAPKSHENTWNSLDMGGVNIKFIPSYSGIFSYTFLVNLYLNHNQLTVVPPAISKLRRLELLDLSGNQLSVLPPELGLLSDLKELYLFDNNLTTLPHELGTLHQLQTLGVEGNPLDPFYMKMIQTEGSASLVRHLRDSCPVPSPPPDRAWCSALTDAEREAMQADGTETVRVLCFNILCEKAATERMYGYTPQWALSWGYRKELILTEMMNYDADFLCLQEVDIGQYENYFVPHLTEAGYEGVYWPKSRYKTMSEHDRKMVDGCATFFKGDKYQLVEKHLVEFSTVAMQRSDFKKTDDMFNRVLGKDHIAVVCLLENKETGTRFIVSNAHIHWDPAFCDVKLVQVALLMDEIEKIANNFAKLPPRPPQPASPGGTAAPSRPPPVYSDGTKIPLIFAGDFNSVKESGVYEFLANGTVPPHHPEFRGHTYGRYTADGLRHRFGLKSAYSSAGEIPMTNYTSNFQGVLDYIWFSTQTLGVNAVLGEVDKSYLEKVVGFPNAHFPSDHIPIAGEFRVKPPRETGPSRPAPVFPPPHSHT